MNSWLNQLFSAGQTAQGNIVRRKKSSVAKYSSMQQLENEVRRRDFHMVETGDQVIVICNSGHLQILV
jgi:hypothetical protein